MGPAVAMFHFSAIDPLDPRQVVGPTGGLLLRDVLLVLGVILLLTVLLLVWAVRYVRRRKHHRHSTTPQILKHSKDSEEAAGDAEGGDTQHETQSHHRRRRHRRRGHRSRNPTLAETGGLPPVRPGAPENPTS